MVLLLAELNGLDSWVTDTVNAFVEAFTKEKVHVIARPEFRPFQGHTLIINKASYRLRKSDLRWHERLSDCLRDMWHEPCKMELE